MSLSLEHSAAPSRVRYSSAIAARNSEFSLLKSVLARRFALLAILLVLEWLPGRGGQSIARWVVAFAWLFFALTYLGNKSSFQRISGELERIPIGWSYFAAHLCLLVIFHGLSPLMAGDGRRGAGVTSLEAAWFAVGCISIVIAAFAFVPPRLWRDLLYGSYQILAGAAGAGVVACQFIPGLWSKGAGAFWRPVTGATFHLVALFLHPFFTRVVSDPSIFAVGSDRFMVSIGGACSGLEGMGLFLVFSAAWLWCCRGDVRFPHALALLPIGVAVMWLLNGVRLAALILIGHAGAPQIALGGFHSQAGFLIFSGVAIGVILSAHRVSWWSNRQQAGALCGATAENPAAWYLVPFLAVITAGMIAHAASSGFEWLYPLRFFAAAAALWYFRAKYADLDWSFGWLAPLIGGIVFVIWLALDPGPGTRPVALTSGLAALPGYMRFAWIAVRALAAVVTVPLVEELAFRGFLIRRLISKDFASLSAQRFTIVSVLLSSIGFGLLHGDRWLAATIAGALYALVLVWRGRIGDAVIAHATTNALLAVWVLVFGKWYLW